MFQQLWGGASARYISGERISDLVAYGANEEQKNEIRKVIYQVDHGVHPRQFATAHSLVSYEPSQLETWILPTMLDFTPIIGDIKGFAESRSSEDFLFASLGVVIPGLGDA